LKQATVLNTVRSLKAIKSN